MKAAWPQCKEARRRRSDPAVIYKHLKTTNLGGKRDRSSAYICFFVSHLSPMGLNVLGYQSHLLQRCNSACGHERPSHLSRFSPDEFSKRCTFSTLTNRELMVEFYLLAFSRSDVFL